MSDNIKKIDKSEIKADNREVDNIVIPDYSYGNSQEGLDARRMRNGGVGIREVLVNNTVYLATSGGIVHGNSGGSGIVSITGHAGNSASPGIVAQSSINTDTAVTMEVFISFPVKKGEYYKINSTNTLNNGYFTPIY